MKGIVTLCACVLALTACVGAPKGGQAPAAPGSGQAGAGAPPEAFRLAREARYFPDGTLDQFVVLEWSADESRLLARVTYEASRPDPVSRVDYQYEGGRLVSETASDGQGAVESQVVYRYDEGGLLLEERRVDAQGRDLLGSLYEYDGKGRRTAWTVSHGSEKVACTEYEYGPSGLVRVLMKDASGALEGSVDVELDPSGREVKRVHRDGSGKISSIETIRWEGTRMAEERSLSADGKAYMVTSYDYGAGDRLLRKVVKDGAGETRSIVSYEYLSGKEAGNAR
jgi:hypothetical protein